MIPPPYTLENYTAERSIGYLVKRSSALMTEIIERTFQEHGVSFTQWVALKNLDDGSNATLTELARKINHDQGSLSRAIDQLEQQGLVRRRRCEMDRRQIRLDLTAAGREFVKAQTPLVIEMLNRIFESFSPEETEVLIKLFNKLVHRLEDFVKPGALKTSE